MKLHVALTVVTTAILLMVTLGAVGGSARGGVCLTLLGQISLIAMVIAILKAPDENKRTFDEYFYRDINYRRNQPRSSRT